MPKLPAHVQTDIRKRVGHWLLAGGSPDAPYMGQQLGYAQSIYERKCQ
ncbi:DUF6877 family protein [Sporolactobacillus sp. KGMB 08714]